MLAKQMLTYYDQLRSKSLREQLAFIILGFVLIYFSWNALLLRPLESERKQLNEHMHALMIDLNVTQNELNKLLSNKKTPTTDSQEIKQNLSKIMMTANDPSAVRLLINKIITYRADNIEFIGMKSEAPVPWGVATTLVDLPQLQEIKKYSFTINFKGDYFGAINYLKFIEKLPNYLYWDSLNYVVNIYPQGSITVQFYTVGK
jgi:MSHA biogenesis protein MshJ